MAVDLSTSYLGLRLAHPMVASAGPVTSTLASLQAVVRAGAAAVVLPSLFEEEVLDFDLDELRMRSIAGGHSEATSYLPEAPAPGPAERYVEFVEQASRSLDVPVIASLNGLTTGGWVHHATELQAAGAAAIELNVYVVAADPGDTAEGVERRILELVRAVRAAVTVPVAVKLSPYFSSVAAMAAAVVAAGADGLVLFNRFYQPDIDLSTLSVSASLELSSPAELRVPLRWVGILRDQTSASLALSGGVHSPEAAVKAVLVGADAVMCTSALLRHGPDFMTALRDGVARWFGERDYESIEQAKGSMSRQSVPDPDGYERANYLQVIRRATREFTKFVG